MSRRRWHRLRRLNRATHRDLGYFFSTLITIYCLSGIALNHVDDWNPDFIIEKRSVTLKGPRPVSIHSAFIDSLGRLVGERQYKVYDIPSADKVKVYYDNASLLMDLATREGVYEKITRRPVFYHSNLLHRNSVRGWKWASDVFAVLLITISLTGIFILKGRHGISGRGKWFMASGAAVPIAVLILNEIL